MSKLTILREAREQIESGREQYICDALDVVGCQNPQLRAAADTLAAQVGDAINNNFGLHHWLDMQCPRADKRDWYTQRDTMRMCRLAWLDKMIEEASK